MLPRNSDSRALFVGAALLAVAAAAPFAGTLDYPFLHDDRWAVVDNPLVDGNVDLGRIFSTNSWGDRPEYPHMHYRPLSVLTLSVTRAAFGETPAPFRVTNVALHATVTVLLFLLMIRLSAGPLAAFAAALWFAVHPVHCETVLFALNREEMMATLFYLGALLAIAPSMGLSGGTPRPLTAGRIGLACLMAALGFLSKETAATIPVLALAIALAWPLRPALTARRGLALAAALFAVLIAGILVRQAVLGRVLSDFIPWQDNPLVLVHGAERLWGALAVIAESAKLLVAPLFPTVDYGYDVLGIPAAGHVAGGLAGMVVVVGVAACIPWFAFRRPLVSIGLLMLAVSWLPFSNALFPNSIILSERNLYLPSAGAAVAMAGALDALRAPLARSRLAGTPATVAVIAVCLLFGFVSGDRSGDYRSAEALFTSSLANRPGSTRLHDNLGLELMKSGRPTEAETHFRRALAIDPSNAEAHNNLGLLLGGAGKPKEAAMEFALALRHRPGMEAALTNLCWLLVRTGEYEAAIGPCGQAKRRGGPVDRALNRIETEGKSGGEH